MRIWDPVTGDQTECHGGIPGWVNSVCAFSATAARNRSPAPATTGLCGTAIWSPVTSRHPSQAHGRAQNSVCAFSANGQDLLASASDDRTVRIWDRTRALCLEVIPTHHPALACGYVAGSLIVALTAGLLAVGLNSNSFEKQA